jgi:hypothetical protein
MESLLYSKSIDYRRDVKRGTIPADPRTDALLARYKRQVKK